MTGFFSKIFGGGKKGTAEQQKAIELIETTMKGLIDHMDFDLSYDARPGKEDEVIVELKGADAELLTEKEGVLLDAFQLFIKRVIQHHLPDDRTSITFDCNGFREESNQALLELAEKLKGIVLEKNRSVYCRALPPKDRKIIHQYLANDTRVKSRSVGEGLYKKIKIYPARERGPRSDEAADSSNA